MRDQVLRLALIDNEGRRIATKMVRFWDDQPLANEMMAKTHALELLRDWHHLRATPKP